MSHEKPDYDIFADLEKYELKESKIYEHYTGVGHHFCYNILISFSNSMDAVKLCNEFVYFYTLLNSEYGNTAANDTIHKYPEFLNYWLNRQFRARSISVTPKSEFYQHLINNYKNFEAENKLNNKIYDIDEFYFNKLNSLYEFYKIIHELKGNNNSNCNKFFEQFQKNYTPAWKKCFSGVDVDFCNALERFRKIYEQNKNSILPVCNTEESLRLPQLLPPPSYQSSGGEAQKIGNSLIHGIQNVTISGLPKINASEYSQLHELISQRYNFLLVYNEDEKRSNMLTILQEFFQYCSRNRENSNLLSFYKEFLREYYIKNKDEYDKIYSECYTSSESIKSYCSIYQSFSEQLKKSILSIKKIEKKDLEDEAKILQWFISNFSFDSIILQLEKENNPLSNITPILVGTLVGVLLILFFLYKFSPFGSWLHRKITKSEKTTYNFDEENNQYLFENNSELEMDNKENRKFHLSYNSG
ncbi:PIR Superfamily Protein [Plasmodium ovale wallikeri]|uniref:PIR Superfamily Protein n=1 Tax=Plasmodium ovale wallikeri TaxID=864142 RepID=A0A1A9AGW8_PLAOA|nr:PIR Superfamily Protein [Plasmodium ovale wallikeri]SBT56233.1 PIR Superfamily Protein [Plasmodium ovale wallikeri]